MGNLQILLIRLIDLLIIIIFYCFLILGSPGQATYSATKYAIQVRKMLNVYMYLCNTSLWLTLVVGLEH